jgi:hypothetical protein
MHVNKSLTIVVFATAAALAQSAGPVNDKEAAGLLKSNEAEPSTVSRTRRLNRNQPL